MTETSQTLSMERLVLDFEPKCLLEYSIAKKSVEEFGITIPFPVVVRNDDVFVKGRELYFLVCKELQIKRVPVVFIEDERLYDRQMIASNIGPKDNPIDMALRIRLYQKRYGINQTQLGHEFVVSQSMVSRYLRVIDYLYPETILAYQKYLKIADKTRNNRSNPRSRRGVVDIGFRHLYELTRVHDKYSKLPEHRSRDLQFRMMDQMGTKCSSVQNLKKKITEHIKRKPTECHNLNDIPRIKAYHSDGRYLLNVLKPESVQLVVTSPPYNLGKPYENSRSIEEHLENIIPPLQSAAHTLIPGGWMIVNIIDFKIGFGEFLPIRDILIYALMACDMRFISPSIWEKKIIKQLDCRNELRSHSNYSIIPNMEYLLILKKKGERELDADLAELSKAMIENDENQNEWRNFSAVMHFNTDQGRNNLEGIGNAVMPNMLADFLIRGFSLIGDNVLDPFAGTGTTLKHAETNNRNGIGFEVSETVFNKYLAPFSAKEAVSHSEIGLPRGWKDMLKIALSCLSDSYRKTETPSEEIVNNLTVG